MLGRMCSKCGQHEQLAQKTICKVCDKIRAAEKRKRSRWGGECAKCGIHVDLLKNAYRLCINCYNEKMKQLKNETKYRRAKTKEYDKMHIRIAEMLSGKDIDKEDLVTHHLNEKKNDNHPRNLSILTRAGHSKLHTFLRNMRAQLTEEKYEEDRLSLTKRFLELYGLSVIWVENLFNMASQETKDLILNLISDAEDFRKTAQVEENLENSVLTTQPPCDIVEYPQEGN